jgi:hypothetical protein
MAQSKKLFYKTLIFMPNYLRKSTNFKIEAKKILNLVYRVCPESNATDFFMQKVSVRWR